MKILITILFLIIISLTLRLLAYKRDLNQLIKEINISLDKNFYTRRLSSPSRIRLVILIRDKINQLIEDSFKNKNIYKVEEEKNKEIIASISHDLRTPLTSIKGYTQLLEKIVVDPKAREYINIIQARSDNLSRLIDSFYDLSRLEASRVGENLEYIDLSQVLTSILANHYERFLDREILPQVQVQDGDFLVLGDLGSIERIFSNLVDNSIKYTKSTLEIFLGFQDGRLITRFINDTNNLNEADFKRIFDKFFIVDSSRQGEGSGLGLFITRQLVESLGYKIQADLKDNNISITIIWS